MYKLFTILLLLFGINAYASDVGHSQVVTTENWDIVLRTVRDSSILPQETFVFFDVNDVLITPMDNILSKAHRKQAINNIKKIHHVSTSTKKTGSHPVLEDPLEVTQTFMDIWSKTEINVVDAKGPDAIKAMQDGGYQVMGLTNGITGKIGTFTDLAAYRNEELYRLGYHFQALSEYDGTLLGHNPRTGTGAPQFKDGIIYTAGLDKGPILETFVQNTHLSPKRIVFVDDKVINLDSVAKFCKQQGIEFVGIHYTALNKPQELTRSAQHVASCQFSHYHRFGQWLSDANIRQTICYKHALGNV